MKKTNWFTICFFFFISLSFAQKELWGYKVEYNYISPELAGPNDGKIIKIPLSGTDLQAQIVYTFDTTGLTGKFPRGRLFQASNEKLYGVTAFGDAFSGIPGIPFGVLFEYDLIFDQYRIVSTGLIGANSGLIEPIPGLLIGTMNFGNTVFKYNLSNETTIVVATLPSFIYNNSPVRPKFKGELMKASDGYLYGVTDVAPTSQNIPAGGGIYRLNMLTNQITKLYVFGFNDLTLDVRHPIYNSKLVEGTPGKLYGTALGGTHSGPDGIAPLGSGTLYEYTIATNTVSKKFDFDYNSNGVSPSSLVYGGNGKLYGSLSGLNDLSYPNPFGSIFEYDLALETISSFHHLDPFNTDDLVQRPFQGSIMYKASNGLLYGMNALGIHSFNPNSNTVNKKIFSTEAIYDNQDVIEICRKPSYHFFDVDTFDTCVGSDFSYDILNSNAETYQWLQNGNNIDGQTTGVLNLTNLSTSDAGDYTCVMTNECGTTTTMTLHVSVNCLGTNTVAVFEDSIKLYPNPTNSILNIVLPTNINITITSLKVIDLIGKEVLYHSYEEPNIDVSRLPKGIYIITIQTNYGNWNGKFVKT